MPLIDFRSDLTALQYGGDRPGGGWSGQPYVQSPNPNNPPTLTEQAQDLFDTFYNANNTTSDYPIRGGVLDITNAYPRTPAGRIDRIRVESFLKSAKGKIFKLKQQGLQLSNPNIQGATILSQITLNTSAEIPGVIEATRLFSPDATSTKLQTEVQGTGIHLQRHGLFPNLANPIQQTYEYHVTRNNTENTNRLAILATLKIKNKLITRNTGRYDPSKANNPIIAGFSTRYGISQLSHQILNYPGGPGSLYGIGNTVINRASDTTQAAEKAVSLYNALTMTYAQLSKQTTRDGTTNWAPKVQDFRSQLAGQPTADYNSNKAWYNAANIGKPGAVPLKNRIDYSKSTVIGVDKVNYEGPFYYDASKKAFWEVDGVETKDIIKFGFECIDNDDPNKAIALVFRAFLTNFSDNNQAELNSFKYLGRGETFRTYQGFDRSISFSFKIAAQSRDEMQPLYKKLNHLITQTYPDYSKSSKLMRASVVKLTIGDYLYRVPGFLESVNISVDDNYPWEIALDSQGVDSDMNQVPQVVDVQCSFKPIHGFLPRRETKDDFFVPLIGNVSTDGKSGWLSGTLQNQ